MLAWLVQFQDCGSIVDVRGHMKLGSLFLAALVTAVPVWAQEAQPATPPVETPREPAPLNLPISLDKIREGLLQPVPAEPLKGLTPAEAPTFHVNITEQQKFEDLLAKIKFDPPGPQVAGGIYAYEQQQRLFPRIDNPRVQPYGAFTTGQVATLAVEALIEKYIAEKMAHVVGDALRAQAEREAREEVARAIAGYWASQSVSSPAAPAAPPKE
jgi:hypothetical protein